MCFSATSSFTAAVVLSTIGIYTLTQVSLKRLYLLAVVPLFFGIQQLSEGVIWVHYAYYPLPKAYFEAATELFLFFALFIWPLWIPLSLFIAEAKPIRKKVIAMDLCAGLILALLNLYYALGQEINVQVVNHSIHYSGEVPSQTIIYPLIVLLPCFLSSVKKVWMYGLLIALTYVFAYSYYEITFVSVWCFFSAITSIAIYKIVQANQYQQVSPDNLS